MMGYRGMINKIFKSVEGTLIEWVERLVEWTKDENIWCCYRTLWGGSFEERRP